MELELWKPIKGYEDRYQISNTGKVKSVFRYNKILRPTLNKYGYLYVGLYSTLGVIKRNIHRIVAEAFIPNPENKPEVNHKDGNKSNNNDWNLEWCTKSENAIHSINKLGNKTSICKPVICLETGIVFDSIQQAKNQKSLRFGVSWLTKMLKGKITNTTSLKLI